MIRVQMEISTPDRTTGAEVRSRQKRLASNHWRWSAFWRVHPVEQAQLKRHRKRRQLFAAQIDYLYAAATRPCHRRLLLRRAIDIAHGFIPDNISDSASSLATHQVIRFEVNAAITPRNTGLIRCFRKRRPGKGYRLSRCRARFNCG